MYGPTVTVAMVSSTAPVGPSISQVGPTNRHIISPVSPPIRANILSDQSTP